MISDDMKPPGPRFCMFKSQGFDWGHAFQPALRLQAWVAGTRFSWMLWGMALGTSEEWPSNCHRLRISPLSQKHSQLNILATRSTGFCLCWVYSLDSSVPGQCYLAGFGYNFMVIFMQEREHINYIHIPLKTESFEKTYLKTHSISRKRQLFWCVSANMCHDLRPLKAPAPDILLKNEDCLKGASSRQFSLNGCSSAVQF